jgi:2-C-methyl-D-erythritol 2,4-cyclodiphosphate synthase
VRLVENTQPNPKITLPADLHWLQSGIMQQTQLASDPSAHPSVPRIGHGYDVHRFVAGRPLVLGGVHVPHTHGLDGHSDADVVSHALADAILGALALPDIGHLFPNTDPAIRGIDSQLIVQQAVAEAATRGWRVGNADISIIAEQPKIGPHIAAMRQRLAASLGVDGSVVGIKATTHEQIGDLGRGVGIAAMAVVLLVVS